VGHLAQAAAAEPEVAVKTAGTTANATAIVKAHCWILAFGGSDPALVLFID
jgi:hypothetical protein